jgi:hypothetical protein
MKKLLLAGIGALSMLSASTAQTSATKAELPDAMLGAWCGRWSDDEVAVTRHHTVARHSMGGITYSLR